MSRILDEIERVLQSDEEFILDDGVEIEVIHVHNPQGGRNRQGYVNLDRFLINKKCIIRIQNVDELCCARAIVTAKAKLDQHDQWDAIRKGRNIQGDLAKELHRQASVPQTMCGIEEVKKFQAVLPEYQIHVVSKEHFNAIIYAGPEKDKKNICILS